MTYMPQSVGFVQALEIVKRFSGSPEQVETALEDAYGCYLAVDLLSPVSVPEKAISAMDGYLLPDDGSDPDGYLIVSGTEDFGSRTAMRVLTGWPVHERTFCVAAEEHCRKIDGRLFPIGSYPRGMNIRPAGEDAEAAGLVIRAGSRLDAASLARIASVGISRIPVARKLRVAVLTSGDELVRLGGERPENGRYESNGLMLSQLLKEWDCTPVLQEHLPDNREAICKALSAIDAFDMLITTGGASNSESDHIRPVMKELGVEFLFERVNIKPGRPTAYGRWNDRPVFVLPGNPVASFVTFYAIVTTAIRAITGRKEPATGINTGVKAVLGSGVEADKRRYLFPRAVFRYEKKELHAIPYPETGSGLIKSLVFADGILSIPPGSDTGPGAIADILWMRPSNQ